MRLILNHSITVSMIYALTYLPTSQDGTFFGAEPHMRGVASG